MTGQIEKGISTTERVVPERKTLTSREITVTFRLRKLLVPAAAALAVIVLGLIGWRLVIQKKGAMSLARVRSIAVMPFEDLSPQKDQGYLCEGPGRRADHEAHRRRGPEDPGPGFVFPPERKGPREIGERLAVDAVLDGTLLRTDRKISVNLQIIDARTGYGIWSGDLAAAKKSFPASGTRSPCGSSTT